MNADAHASGDDGERSGNRPPLHLPVLLQSVLSILELRSGLVVVDGTVGAGGHAIEISQAIGPDGLVVGIDRDQEILVAAQEALADAKDARAGASFSLHHSAHASMCEVLLGAGQPQCDRVLLDLGVSSLQLDHPERGFSFMADGPLDMRMDADAPLTAAQWLAKVSEVDLANTLYQLGEERFSRRIARRIVEERRRTPVVRTSQLSELVVSALPGNKRHGRIHAATRTFQAVRMAVNDEMGELERGMQAALDSLAPGGRLAVISFHSIEDRLVKHWMRANMSVVTKKPIIATPAEAKQNPRSRSAKLRCAVKPEDAA